jgi:flagellar hook-basal body complex protein FliE
MIPPIGIGPLGASGWSIGGMGSPGAATQVGTGASAGAAPQSSFGTALSNAIDSLEQGQAAGTQAAQRLATGQLSDPTQAVTAVENASLEMQLAAQIRTKLLDAEQTIFGTQM